jgi:hypothetical protein
VPEPFYGRNPEIDLVRRLMLREADATDLPQPVLVIEGGAATGKTLLLHELARRCAGTVPCAYLDLAGAENEPGNVDTPELLAALAFQLARHCRLYGSLRFNRLVIGLLARRWELDRLDRRRAQAQVRHLLRERLPLSTVKNVLADLARDALRLGAEIDAGHGAVGAAVDLVVDKAASWLSTRGRPGRFAGWYGHQDAGLGLDPVDELVELNRSARALGGGDEVLWSAFLADLRDNFRTARRAREWSMNCLVLLDNADTELGRVVLRGLTGSRRLGVGDPLTVVATTRGDFLAELSTAERAKVRPVSGGGQDGEIADRETVWLLRRLPPFSVDEIREMTRRLGISERDALNLGTLLYRIGRGHPGGTRILLDAAAGAWSGSVKPAELLGPQLEDALRERLLAGVPEAEAEALTICAAGRDPSEGLRLREEIRPEPFPVGLWEPGTHITLLRLLLLRRLARRPEDWRAAHERLRKAGDDLEAELYHSLALGKVTTVAAVLTQQLAEESLANWLTLLDGVTTAPRPPTPLLEAGDGTSLAFVEALVASLQEAADPMCGADRGWLYARVAEAYRDLFRHTGGRSDELLDRIRRYDRLSALWRRGSHEFDVIEETL